MRFTILAVTTLFVAGCASGPPQFTEEQRQEYANTTPVCQTDRECERAWSAAQSFVRNNAGFRIRTVSDSYLGTFGPRRLDSGLAFEASKQPVDGGYEIVAQAQCGPGINCRPTRGTALVEFNRQVNAAID